MRSGIVKVGAAALFGVGASAIHYSYLKYKRSNNHIATGTGTSSRSYFDSFVRKLHTRFDKLWRFNILPTLSL